MTPEELTRALAPTTRAINRLARVLERVLDATAEPELQGPTCPHPEECRIQHGASWICELCQQEIQP